MNFNKAVKTDSGMDIVEIPMPIKVDSLNAEQTSAAFELAGVQLDLEQAYKRVDALQDEIARLRMRRFKLTEQLIKSEAGNV